MRRLLFAAVVILTLLGIAAAPASAQLVIDDVPLDQPCPTNYVRAVPPAANNTECFLLESAGGQSPAPAVEGAQVTPQVAGVQLPRTGSDTNGVVTLGGVLLGTGVLAVAAAAARRQRPAVHDA